MKKRKGTKINFYKASMKKGRVEKQFPMAVIACNSLLVGVVGVKLLASFPMGLDQFVSEIIR